MRPIASARPKDIYTYVNGKRYTHLIINSEEVTTIESRDILNKVLQVAYQHAVVYNRQLLYAMIGDRCWMYKDRELSTIIDNIKKNKPEWSKQIINKLNL